MTRLRWTICAVMFGAPFALLAAVYDTLPAELPVLRNPFAGHALMMAPKSVFVVFRVPTMNLIHGSMAALMLSRAADFSGERRVAYSSTFSTLMFAVAFKSNFEAMEMGAIGPATWLGIATGASVVLGLGLALIRGRRAPLPWPELRLTIREKVALAALFGLYVGIVIGSFA